MQFYKNFVIVKYPEKSNQFINGMLFQALSAERSY